LRLARLRVVSVAAALLAFYAARTKSCVTANSADTNSSSSNGNISSVSGTSAATSESADDDDEPAFGGSRPAAARFFRAALTARAVTVSTTGTPASSPVSPVSTGAALGVGDAHLLLDLVHIAPCEAVFRVATAAARALDARKTEILTAAATATATASADNAQSAKAAVDAKTAVETAAEIAAAEEAAVGEVRAFARAVLSESAYVTAQGRGVFGFRRKGADRPGGASGALWQPPEAEQARHKPAKPVGNK